jgi:hypothetical protein
MGSLAPPWIRRAALHLGNSTHSRLPLRKSLFGIDLATPTTLRANVLLAGGHVQRRSAYMQKTDEIMQWGFTHRGEALREYRQTGANPVGPIKYSPPVFHVNESESFCTCSWEGDAFAECLTVYFQRGRIALYISECFIPKTNFFHAGN